MTSYWFKNDRSLTCHWQRILRMPRILENPWESLGWVNAPAAIDWQIPALPVGRIRWDLVGSVEQHLRSNRKESFKRIFQKNPSEESSSLETRMSRDASIDLNGSFKVIPFPLNWFKINVNQFNSIQLTWWQCINTPNPLVKSDRYLS